MFSPEFRNRLDATIFFNSLSLEIIERVVDKFITELDLQLNEKKVFLHLSPNARRWLAEKGYDPVFGARPMARLIQTEIKRVLADEILFGRLQNGGKVEVDEGDNKLTFTYSEVDRAVSKETATTEPWLQLSIPVSIFFTRSIFATGA